MNRVVFLLLLQAFTSGVTAAEPAYVVRLTDAALVDEPGVVAKRLARTYGGKVESVSPETVVLTISDTRARLPIKDPRVASIAPRLATDAVDWNTGLSYQYDATRKHPCDRERCVCLRRRGPARAGYDLGSDTAVRVRRLR